MHLKSILLPLVLVASASSAHASTPAFSTVFDPRDVAIGGRTLVARTTSTTVTGTTLTGTKTVTSPRTTSTASCNLCECLTALAAEGVACAAAILEGGCNLLADISCIVDAIAFARAIPSCLACL
ncbi:hypothetical protein FB451DRAFT_1560702 [Mycena latifolia]|nr:hypothetical protein FB451DRAFT_1560702 [Mycena latifolia]